MDEHLIEKLRSGKGLRNMRDGREGVAVTLQFQGRVPVLSRSERKAWLQQHFTQLGSELAHLPIQLDPASVSVSGQTVEATCALDCLPELKQAVEPGGHKIEIVRTMQAAPE